MRYDCASKMTSPFEIIRACLLAVVILLAVAGPPAWWYWHGKKPGERREKKWGAIFFGILLVISMGYVRPTAEWLGWLANVGRLVAACWIIAWGAKGSPA